MTAAGDTRCPFPNSRVFRYTAKGREGDPFSASVVADQEDVVVLDLRGLSDITDYFVICHGTSERRVVAIADAVEARLEREHSLRPDHVEGRKIGDWVLMDYIDFVVHIFVEEKRAFYRLERLWGDATRIEPPPSSDRPAAEAPSPL